MEVKVKMIFAFDSEARFSEFNYIKQCEEKSVHTKERYTRQLK